MNYFSFILFYNWAWHYSSCKITSPRQYFRVFIIFLIISINIVPHFITVNDSRVSNRWGSDLLIKTNLEDNRFSTGIYLSSFVTLKIIAGYGVDHDEITLIRKGHFFLIKI